MRNNFPVTILPLLMIALLSLSMNGFAKEKEENKYHSQSPHAMHHGTMYEEMLDLTEEQQTKIEQINKTFIEQIKKVREINSKMGLMQVDLDDPAYHQKVKQIAKSRAAAEEQITMLQAEKQANIYAVLNTEQKQKFKELRKTHLDKKQEWQKKREAKTDAN